MPQSGSLLKINSQEEAIEAIRYINRPVVFRDKLESDMKEFIEFIVKHLVEDPDQVWVTEEKNEKGLLYKLVVGENDIGRVVGKEGRTARSIRTLLTAAAARQGKRANLEILDGTRERAD